MRSAESENQQSPSWLVGKGLLTFVDRWRERELAVDRASIADSQVRSASDQPQPADSIEVQGRDLQLEPGVHLDEPAPGDLGASVLQLGGLAFDA